MQMHSIKYVWVQVGSMAQNDTATIAGTTTENTTGPYGETGCDETMHVVFDGQDVFVPFNGVRASGYDFHGAVPDEFDADRIINYDGHVHAEADVEGGVVEIVPDYNGATAEFRGYDRWELQKFDGETGQAGTVIYERDE